MPVFGLLLGQKFRNEHKKSTDLVVSAFGLGVYA